MLRKESIGLVSDFRLRLEFPKLCINRHCIESNDTGSNAIVSNDTGLKDNKTTYDKQHRGKECEKRVISFYE